MAAAKKKMTMAKAKSRWEGSRADMALDKKMKVAENSPADKKMDMAGARKLMKKKG